MPEIFFQSKTAETESFSVAEKKKKSFFWFLFFLGGYRCPRVNFFFIE